MSVPVSPIEPGDELAGDGQGAPLIAPNERHLCVLELFIYGGDDGGEAVLCVDLEGEGVVVLEEELDGKIFRMGVGERGAEPDAVHYVVK